MVISFHPLPFFVWVWIAFRGRRRNLAQGAGSAKTVTGYGDGGIMPWVTQGVEVNSSMMLTNRQVIEILVFKNAHDVHI